MKECSFCGRRAVYNERRAGVYRCDRCFKENIEKRFRRTIDEYDLIEPGDIVAAAVSGGTDSLTSLILLKDYSEYRDIKLVSLTIDEGIEDYRDESLPIARENAEKIGVDHVIISFKRVFGKTLDELAEISRREDGPDPCTLCGILRRSLLNQASRELNVDKLSIGHNLDDQVQTVLLNYLRGDLSRLYRLGPRTEGKEGFVPRIKPLREITEKETAIYAMLEGAEAHIDECPHVGGMRSEVREFLNRMERNHPTTKFKVLRMFDRIRDYLPEELGRAELESCEICGEPSTGKLCRACQLLDKIGIERKEKRLISEQRGK